jgi:hypothetical protein
MIPSCIFDLARGTAAFKLKRKPGFWQILFFLSLWLPVSAANAQACLPDGITFGSQAEIDAFPANYPGCIEISGLTVIRGSDITKLDSLAQLTALGSGLSIAYNDSLVSLRGLDNIAFLGADLIIWQNPALINLSGLEQLTSINGDLSIWANPVLESLHGLDNVAAVSGLLEVSENGALKSLDGLGGLHSVAWDLHLVQNASLESLHGLDNLSTVNWFVKILGNDALTSLSGLDALTYAGALNIDSNPSLESLDGLGNLNALGGFIRIQHNDVLASLNGLSNLVAIGGELSILNHMSLPSLSGLDNIDPQSIAYLNIAGNLSLSGCAVQSTCEYLAVPENPAVIFMNASNCADRATIIAACEAISIAPTVGAQPTILAFPNPVSQGGELTLYLSSDTGERHGLRIYSATGQLLLSQPIQGVQHTVDMSTFPPGIYLFEVMGTASVWRERLVVAK